MIIPGKFRFHFPSRFSEEPFSNFYPIVSIVKLSPAVATILNLKYSNAFYSETTNMIKANLYMNVH
jgi:hypothetical protein